jgi:peptidoglycan-N-acetylglucosamine deacetylase
MRSRRSKLGVRVVIGLLAAGLAVLSLAELVHAVGSSDYGALAPVCRVSTGRSIVALSFDDGPDPSYTPLMIELLGGLGDRATFFLTGSHAEAFPELVRSELDAGMEIGNHTWSHPHLSDLSPDQAAAEVGRTQRELAREAGSRSTLFRAPYGVISPDQLAAVQAMGLKPIHWSIPLDHYVDGLGLDPKEAAARLLADIRPGDIILAHDAADGGIDRGRAMATLRILMPALQRRGIEVTTVSDLLTRGTAVRASPRIWFWQSGFSCPRP